MTTQTALAHYAMQLIALIAFVLADGFVHLAGYPDTTLTFRAGCWIGATCAVVLFVDAISTAARAAFGELD